MLLPDLLRVWSKVAGLPRASFVEVEWRERLGDDYEALGPLLRTEVEPATGFPCPDPIHEGCPRRVVQHGADDIVAVCGNASPQCEPLRLSKKDLVVRRLDTTVLLAEIAAAFRAANGLLPLTLDAPPGIVPIGTLRQRRLTVPVVWMPEALPGFESNVSALREGLAGDGLFAVLPAKSTRSEDRQVRNKCVLLSQPQDNCGDLALWRGLDLLEPGYRGERIRKADAIFDDIRVELAEEPGRRHVVRVNGRELEAFEQSDLRFLRLVALAAARRSDPDVDDGGWLEKFRLHGDEKDNEILEIRNALRSSDTPGLSGEELRSLIKGSPNRDGRIRLAVCPASVDFDDSLAGFVPIGDHQNRSKQGVTSHSDGGSVRKASFASQAKTVRQLVDLCRRLGAPLPAPPPKGRGGNAPF